MQMPQAKRILCLLCLLVVGISDVKAGNENDWKELVATETSLINTLREYIEELEEQLTMLKKETSAIEEIHQMVGDQVEEYIGNPLNVLTILKRFHSDWPRIEQQANETLNLAENQPDIDVELQLPSEEDYESALLNLLRLQSVYELEPNTLSLGVVNGLKLGSVMSWSDCLEMARMTDRNGDYAVAKYWLETAMGKLPAGRNATIFTVSEEQRGKVQILEASLSMDYRAGEFQRALETAKELLTLQPTRQKVLKAKATIEQAISQGQKKLPTKRKSKQTKSVEQLLTDELCRAATQQVTTGSRMSQCRQDVSNLRMLRLEQLSEDPYIMLYHDVLSIRQTEKLISRLDDKPQEGQVKEALSFDPMEVSKLGQKMLRGIRYQLDSVASVELWQARRHSHEHVTGPEFPSSTTANVWHVARAMLQLQESKLGGSLVFPQLELSVNVPRGSILLWHIRSLNELPRLDYRSRQLVCPVLLGTQLSLWTDLK